MDNNNLGRKEDSLNYIRQLNMEYKNQTSTNTNFTNDEELLKAFIGSNYEKITNRQFNFAGFFFTMFYMFYRKMFLYSVLLFLVNLVVLNVINNLIVILVFNIVVGLFVNKLYIYYANKKIAKIKFQNSEKDVNELKEICATKGGTSVGNIFLGFVAELSIAFIVLIVMFVAGIGGMIENLFNPNNENNTIRDNEININEINDNIDNFTSTADAILIEDVIISGYTYAGDDLEYLKYNKAFVKKADNDETYLFRLNNVDLFTMLGDYRDYLKVDIYYTQKGDEKIIIDYKVFLKSSNEEITNVKNEDELRNKIGLYATGIHTDVFTLSEIGMIGGSYKDNTTYTYKDYTFVDNKNIEYDMRYINPDGTINFVEGNKYTVTFEVLEGTFGYEFYIRSIN